MDLASLGWCDFFQQQIEKLPAGLVPARVAAQHRSLYRLYSAEREYVAQVSGRLRQCAAAARDFPAVGDWVLIAPRAQEARATIHRVLERKSKFARKAAGRAAEEQVAAANIDTVFLVTSLDHDFSVRRLERYLVMAWESGARPVIVLNKADACPDTTGKRAAAQAVAPGAAVHVISCVDCSGLSELGPYFGKGETVALLGSSGVGKSTLINRLLGGERQRTASVRPQDSKGRHTTTHRELILLPGGGMIVDTPGMRELQLWQGDQGLAAAFDDIEALAAQCRFRNCTHLNEPGCAVINAVAAGRLDRRRLENYHKAQQELRYLATKLDRWAALEEKKKWKSIHKAVRNYYQRG